jgi:hypothetical protein
LTQKPVLTTRRISSHSNFHSAKAARAAKSKVCFSPVLTKTNVSFRFCNQSNFYFRKHSKQNADATPKRWSAPQNTVSVSFKLDSVLDETRLEASKSAPTPVQQPGLNDSAKQEFINCLEDYCNDILKTRREKFVDLKDFKEQVILSTCNSITILFLGVFCHH